jgi:hypothetical protein
MILVAALAAGIALVRSTSPADLTPPASLSLSETWTYVRNVIIHLLVPGAVVGMLTVLALQLRSPRPPLWRLARQSGMVACASVALVLTIGLLGLLVIISMDFWVRQETFMVTEHWTVPFWEIMAAHCGYGVAVAWLTLSLSGRWRSEPSWISRIGIALGVFWLAMIPIFSWPLITRLRL